MVKAKLSKKQLTEADEFITLTQRAYLFASDHARKILYAVAAVVVVVAAIFLYQWWQRDKEAKAGRDLSAVMAAFQRVGSPSQEDYRSFLPKFDEVSTKYSGTPSGRLSLLYKASVHLRLKEFDEAIRAYQVFLEKGRRKRSITPSLSRASVMPSKARKTMTRPSNPIKRSLISGMAFRWRIST